MSWEGMFDTSEEDLGKVLKPLVAVEKKVLPMKADSVIRISELSWLCPREEVICSLMDIERTDKEDIESSFRMNLGTEYHRVLQNDLLGPARMIQGVWKCERCNAVHGLESDPIYKPKKCSWCRAESRWLLYKELEVFDKERLIRGHCDGPFEDSTWEFKTTSAFRFSELTTPLPSHIAQASLYAYYLHRKTLRVLYINREAPRFVGMTKLYIVPRNDAMVAGNWMKVDMIREGIVTKKLPGKICTHDRDKRAKYCAVAPFCWSNDDTITNGAP